ncbi:unnamed protein product, partial [Symbiodinium sp. KB8]
DLVDNFEYPGTNENRNLKGQLQLGALQYPRNANESIAEWHHYLEIMSGTYDSKLRNMRIRDNLYGNTQFIAAFPVERVPKHPLSGISTRSGDLCRFSFSNLVANRVDQCFVHMVSYQLVTLSGAGSTITGNILNDGQTPITTIEMQGVSAGQLATVLTAYTPLTDTTTNTAAIGTNSAAVAALQAQVAALPSPPDLTPYALAADLAAAEGLVAANSSSLASLSTSLTTGLACKANQSALDALQLDVDGKSTPASVDLKLANHPTNTSMNSAITSANNATLATVAANYGLKSTQDQQAVDIAARQTAADVDQKIATALLDRPTTTDLNGAVALRTTPADVDQKIATALLPLVAQTALDAYQTAADVASALAAALASHTDTAGLNALLAVRDARLDGHDADIL